MIDEYAGKLPVPVPKLDMAAVRLAAVGKLLAIIGVIVLVPTPVVVNPGTPKVSPVIAGAGPVMRVMPGTKLEDVVTGVTVVVTPVVLAAAKLLEAAVVRGINVTVAEADDGL